MAYMRPFIDQRDQGGIILVETFGAAKEKK